MRRDSGLTTELKQEYLLRATESPTCRPFANAERLHCFPKQLLHTRAAAFLKSATVKLKDLTGKTFGRLVCVSVSEQSRKRIAVWVCRCACGNIVHIRRSNLTSGNTCSCGCLKTEALRTRPRKHGETVNGKPSIEYRTWVGMKTRCYNAKDKCFLKYGALGIRICDRWLHSFDAFLLDMGRRPPGTTIDRIMVSGDYTPKNCRWATMKQQQNNRSNNRRIEFNGLTLTASEWDGKLGFTRGTVSRRLWRGWNVKQSLETPTR